MKVWTNFEMKKLLFICLCMGAAFFLYAQESTAQSAVDAQAEVSVSDDNADLQEAHEKNSADRIVAINTLLKNKELKKNFGSIRTEAQGLSFAEKNALFSKHKSESGISAAINFFIGYGIGSFVQKDTVNGVICLSADVIASGLYLAATFVMVKDALIIAINPSSNVLDRYKDAFNSSSNPLEIAVSMLKANNTLGLFIAGGIIFGLSRIYGVIAPLVYGSSYNKKLEEALGLKDTQISFSPIVMPDASCGLALSIRY